MMNIPNCIKSLKSNIGITSLPGGPPPCTRLSHATMVTYPITMCNYFSQAVGAIIKCYIPLNLATSLIPTATVTLTFTIGFYLNINRKLNVAITIYVSNMATYGHSCEEDIEYQTYTDCDNSDKRIPAQKEEPP